MEASNGLGIKFALRAIPSRKVKLSVCFSLADSAMPACALLAPAIVHPAKMPPAKFPAGALGVAVMVSLLPTWRNDVGENPAVTEPSKGVTPTARGRSTL